MISKSVDFGNNRRDREKIERRKVVKFIRFKIYPLGGFQILMMPKTSKKHKETKHASSSVFVTMTASGFLWNLFSKNPLRRRQVGMLKVNGQNPLTGTKVFCRRSPISVHLISSKLILSIFHPFSTISFFPSFSSRRV